MLVGTHLPDQTEQGSSMDHLVRSATATAKRLTLGVLLVPYPHRDLELFSALLCARKTKLSGEGHLDWPLGDTIREPRSGRRESWAF